MNTAPMKKTLICIDRDGTLIYDEKDHLFLGKDPDWASKMKILPGVIEGLKKLRNIPNASLYMITNQPGVAILDYPLLTVEKAHEVCRYVLDQIKAIDFLPLDAQRRRSRRVWGRVGGGGKLDFIKELLGHDTNSRHHKQRRRI